MFRLWHKIRSTLFKTRRRRILLGLAALLVATPVLVIVTLLVLWTVPIFGSRAWLAPHLHSSRSFFYFHDVVRRVPWSIHVVRIRRSEKDLVLYSMLGRGTNFAMATVTEQIKRLPPDWGQPIAAVNGDLSKVHPAYPGDPEGLQIVHGELVSGPSTKRACFWIDAAGNPHRGDVRSRFEATWPNGIRTPMGLNEERGDNGAVLYTAVVGARTRTRNGLDLVLERYGSNAWLPLQIGRTNIARVRSVYPNGNAPLNREVMVLSVGSNLVSSLPTLAPGAVLSISTATIPDLAGAPTAIGGSPTLVANGKVREWPGLQLRHPRTAVGWNNEYLFLVEVDGRQLRLSAGMTFPELADYMRKLGCQEALNLDGGGSATCWVYGNVMNNPSQGRERPSANGLVLVQKPPSSKLATASKGTETE